MIKMKATGIVRRMDDLGRVVIPKEIRRSMKVREGDPLEIYTNGEYICFKKYNMFHDMQVEVAKILEASGKSCAVFDNSDYLVAYHNMRLPLELENLLLAGYCSKQISIDGDFVGTLVYHPDEMGDEIANFIVSLIRNILATD